MAIEKTLNTRIQLKYDTLANWNASTFNLKKGEIALVEVPTNEGTTLQPVMFKVGVGDKKFSELDWASAKAADVYSWAKKSGIDVEDNGTGSVVSDIKWENNKLVITRIDVYTKAEADQKFQPVGNYKNKQTAYAENGSNTKTITQVTQNENGEVNVVYSDIDFPITGVTGKDAIAVTSGKNPEVSLTLDPSGNVVLSQSATGLKATIDLSDYALAENIPTEDEIKTAALAAVEALIKSSDDTNADVVIENINALVDYVNKNAGDIAQLVVNVGTANDNAAAALETANGASDVANSASGVANEAKDLANNALEAASNA